ncbi:OTU domain-containing protein 3-like [Tachysurus ichikawai]
MSINDSGKSVHKGLDNDWKSRPPGDDEGEEFDSFSNQLKALGLKLREVPGDGNCLFRALADQLEGHSRNHLHLRHKTVQYMQSHREDFEPFVEDDVPFTKHVSDLAEPGTFAGNDAIVAFARSQQVKVVIHQLNAALWEINGSEKPLCQELHIAYRNGNHYDSVRHLADNSESPAHLRIANLNNSRRLGDGEKCKQKAPSPSHSPSDDEDVILNSLKITVCPPETSTTHKPKLSNKQRKKQRRLEKKKKREERHRQKVLQDIGSHHQNQNLLGPITLVPALSTLSI